MSSDTYNGWTNRETWLVNVWFNPESKEDVRFARETLEEEEDKLTGCLKDMSSLSEVNWEELEAAFEEEEEEEEEEDEDDEDGADEPGLDYSPADAHAERHLREWEAKR